MLPRVRNVSWHVPPALFPSSLHPLRLDLDDVHPPRSRLERSPPGSARSQRGVRLGRTHAVLEPGIQGVTTSHAMHPWLPSSPWSPSRVVSSSPVPTWLAPFLAPLFVPPL